MKGARSILLAGLVAALLIGGPAGALAAPDPPATTSASAKKTAKKALKSSKKAGKKAKKARKLARANAKAIAALEETVASIQALIGNTLPADGAYRLTIPPGAWVPLAATGGTVGPGASLTTLERASAADGVSFILPVTLPVDLLGQTPVLGSYEVCYNATSPDATIASIGLSLQTNENEIVIGPLISDGTDRDDSTCAEITLPEPTPIGPDDFLQVLISVDFSAPGSISVGRTSLNFSL